LGNRVERSGSETLALYAADKIAKVRELGLLSTWRANQRKNQAKLAHYRAGREMLRHAAGHTGLVICLDAELGASSRVGESGGWVGLFGVGEFDCAEPFEWPVDEEDLEREVGLDVGL